VAVTDSIDAVLGDPEVDAVVIATPVATHHAIALKALAAGKHILVEKPMARSLWSRVCNSSCCLFLRQMVSFLCDFAQVCWFLFSIKDAFDTFERVVGDVAIAYVV
jgi:hypothetical protein